jgi:hypothetical protein
VLQVIPVSVLFLLPLCRVRVYPLQVIFRSLLLSVLMGLSCGLTCGMQASLGFLQTLTALSSLCSVRLKMRLRRFVN